ncbi:uncharacterized protein LOC112082980 [Eutrema salsugineum]|uniref:uncharacterized protein LOC112082980 n=1 Tax=Eutrema salsugineum TaxID=72664 RepID=UPI000CED617E|nr:uncharacterized protein LOC112082980 [Eutrema salsugineum]
MEINAKVDTMYNDLNGKYEAVWTHVKKLDVQVAQTAESVKRSPGNLPGKGENPINEFVNAIELRSGKTLHAAPTIVVSERRKEKVMEQLLQEGAPTHGVKKTIEHTSSTRAPAPYVEETMEHPGPSTDHLLRPTAPANLPVRVYTPKMIQALKRYMKGLVSEKVVEEESVMMVSKECSAVLQNKMLKKRSDPGIFVLSVRIGNVLFARSLCDLGSSVNLMPYSVAKRLDYTRFKPKKNSLVYADRSTKFPVGILEDLHVQIGDTLIPADFVVLELDEEPKEPLILGRSFLCTAGAIIDVKGGKPMLDGQTFVIDDCSDIAEEVAEEVLAIDPLEVASQNPKKNMGI